MTVANRERKSSGWLRIARRGSIAATIGIAILCAGISAHAVPLEDADVQVAPRGPAKVLPAQKTEAAPAVEVAAPEPAASIGEVAGKTVVPMADRECLAGCNRTVDVGALRREATGAARAGVEPNGAIECIAGCGGTGSRSPSSTTQSQSGMTATSDANGSNRVTVLRGVTRSKVYSTGN